MAIRLLGITAALLLIMTACGLGAPASVSTGTPTAPLTPAVNLTAAAPAPAGAPAAVAPRAAASPAASPAAAPAAAPAAKPAAVSAAAPGPAPAAAQPGPGRQSTDPSNAAQTLPLAQPLDRMIVYTSELTVLVKSIDKAINDLNDIAVLAGGYLAGVENTTDSAGMQVSTVRLKVLPERYAQVMQQIRGLPGNAVEVRDEKASTQDVTEEYNDVQTQLASLEATHRQLVEIMSKATNMDELLKVQAQAAQIKLQIDRLKGRATLLERLSGLATITVRLQPAGAVLGKDFTTVRAQLRQAQAQYAAQQIALQKAKTPEEQNAIRDKLAELQLQIDRAQARLNEVTEKATQAGVTLPTVPPEDATPVAAPETELPGKYIAARVALRRAEAAKADLMRRLGQSPAQDEQNSLRPQLQERILEINAINTQLKSVQERAGQLGVTLPSLSAEEEAALAGTTTEVGQPDLLKAIVTAWAASLTFLRAALTALVGAVVYLWWVVLLAAVAAALIARRLGLHAPWRSHPTPPSAA